MMIKKITHLSVLLLLLLVFPFNAGAIPNQFGVATFTNPAGMRLEDFAAQKEIWKPNADLKGTWEMWRDESVTDSTIELLHLNMSAVVFGVTASEVTVQRRNGKILQFQVVFEPDKQINSFEKLNRIVRTNASLWAGETAEANTMKEGSAAYTFTERSEQKELVVTIKAQ